MKTINILKRDIEKAFQVPLIINSRKRKYVNARIAFAQICREYLDLKLSSIGDEINKDHATILHYTKIFEGVYKSDLAFRNDFNKINPEDYIISGEQKIKKEIKLLENKLINLKNRLKDAV